MSTNYKSSQVFNLEDRKRNLGKPITEVDIFQWKSVLLEELRKNTKFNTILFKTGKNFQRLLKKVSLGPARRQYGHPRCTGCC